MHKSVLLNEAVSGLNLKDNDIFVDCTAGSGGHSELIAKTVKNSEIVCIDLDEDALNRVDQKLKPIGIKYYLEQNNFKNIDTVLEKNGIKEVGGIILDLGLSSNQFEESGRGFSFKRDEPLLMTFKKNFNEQDLTAYEIVNKWECSEIEKILRDYGEEKFSRRIAQKICEYRENKTINRSSELAEIVANAVPIFYRKGRTNPATKTFQALRIAVNSELENLIEVLPKCLSALKSKGRVSVISFHSLEDRIVKHSFVEWEKDGKGKRVTKKPIIPTELEIQENPRSRSAKLRIFEKI